MKIKVLSKSDDAMQLLLEETEPSYANALRRVLVSDVPKMAIEDVEFHLGPIRADDGKEYESVGPLFDEMIAHRLGLVPIPTDLALYNRREDCPTCHGEGCPNCTIIYSVNKRGPGVVTSADLEPIGDAKLRPKDSKIPIVKLGDGQAMLIYATAVLGSGKDHAKWQSTHGVGYRYPHDDPHGVVPQQYPPDDVVGRDYYEPTMHGSERAVAERVPRLRRVIRGVEEEEPRG